MLSRDENDLLTQTSSGTPMGDYTHRFWMPVMLVEKLGEPDSASLRVRLVADRLSRYRRPCRLGGPALPASLRKSVLRA